MLLVLCVFGLWAGCGAAEGDAMPLLVGGHAHGEQNIEALAELGIGNFVWIPAPCYPTGNVPWDEEHDVFSDVDACVATGLNFMFSGRRGLGDETRPGGYNYGGHADEFYEEEAVRRIVERGGDYVVGLHCEEMDADMIQNALRPSFRTRSPALYQFRDRAGGRKSFEGELAKLRDRYHSWGVDFIPNLCVTYHHCGFRAGADIVIAELLEHLPTTELQLAYLRGAARQFGGDWGVWVSPWWIGKIPCEDKELWPREHAQPGGGHSARSFRRCLYLSFLSGARLLCCQETAPLLVRDEAGEYGLASWGRELKAFWEYAREHDEPFEPMVPTAVLIDRNNGWAPAHLWIDWTLEDTVWGKLPTDRTDDMLAEYLNVFLPGYGRTSESVKEREDMYPGYFAATPHGPFDIVCSDISADALAGYQVVVALGGISMTPHLHETLRQYVSSGGTLLVNAAQMRHREAFVQDEELLGATLGNGNWTRIFAAQKIQVEKELPGISEDEFTEPWFAAIEVQVQGAEVVASTDGGQPVLLRNEFGEGIVYLSTPEYMQDGWGEQKLTLGLFRELIGGLAERGPVDVEAADDISWIASRQGGDSVVVAVANHGGVERKAEVVWRPEVKEASLEIGSSELVTEETEAGTVYGVTVPPEDVVIVRIGTD